MTGWLIVNHFLKSGKFGELEKWLIDAAARFGIELIKKTNAEVLCALYEREEDKLFSMRPEFVLFWDKDIRLAKYLEAKGIRLFNPARAIEVCDDKALTHIGLFGSGIKMPKTIIAPMTFANIGYNEYGFLDDAVRELGYPIVVKECFGSFGAQVYLAEDYGSLLQIVRGIGPKPMLFQEFVASSRGRDVRINVVGGRPVAAMQRHSENGDFKANVTNGGKMKRYEPTDAQLSMAVLVCNKLGLDFAGVDILFGEHDEPILCEVNSNAHIKNIYDCTGVNVANDIMRHIKKEMRG